jgi:hypothetical protein
MKSVFRFCDANDSTTCLSNAAQQGMALPSDNWQGKGVRRSDVLQRAAAHMDGKTALSPFVSIATDVLALVKWGVSGGLLDIIYGVDHPERRAPHIVTFQVPENAIISPEDIVAAIPAASGYSGIMRSRLETELLYYGNDIKRYQRSFIENPYTNLSYQTRLHNEQQTQVQEQQLAEAAAARELEQQELARASQPAGMSAKRVKEGHGTFRTDLNRFLQAQSTRLKAARVASSDIAALDPSTAMTTQIGQTLRRFDSAVLQSADPELVQAWLECSKPYRG